MTTLFISDLHLDPARPEITAAFSQFLDEQGQTADVLYILGDFFEFWIGDDDDHPFVDEVSAMLKKYVDSGKELYMLVGNRDFLMGKAYADRCGAKLIEDPHCLDLNGTTVLLMHGDSLCTDDVAYQAFRQQARSSVWQQAVLSKPLQERRLIAQQMRQQSKTMSSNKPEDIMDVTEKAVLESMEKAGVKQLIHGHTHRPAHHQHRSEQGENLDRWVLGDWDSQMWWIEADNDGRIELRSQPI